MDNEPAFPLSQNLYGGMTLLDYFAGQACSAVLQNEYRTLHVVDAEKVAKYCFNMAEAMMAERKRRSERAE